MHIPDGFLTSATWVPAWLLSMGGIGYSLKKASQTLRERMIPLMGVMSAFIFAAQMVNFPVMTCVLIVQCLIFQDGGLTALGANIFNMSIVGTMGGYGVYKIISGNSGNRKAVLAGTAVASWFSVVAASSCCAIQLALSDLSPLAVVLPAMAGVHAVIGVGEAMITTVVIGFVLKVRPDLLYGLPRQQTNGTSSLLQTRSLREEDAL
jgi:cobalt/nickel transport system permease protein